MSGNVYANFITDAFKSDLELCLEAVEKGKVIYEYVSKNPKDPALSIYGNGFKNYVYKGKKYQHFYNAYPVICEEY